MKKFEIYHQEEMPKQAKSGIPFQVLPIVISLATLVFLSLASCQSFRKDKRTFYGINIKKISSMFSESMEMPRILSNTSQPLVKNPGSGLKDIEKWASLDNAGLPDSNKEDFNYVPSSPPDFIIDPVLQSELNKILFAIQENGFPLGKTSVSIVKLTDSNCCLYAGFNDNYPPRYPASIVKLFWMAFLYGQYNSEIIERNTVSESEVHRMIYNSDNEAASYILDIITDTKSGDELSQQDFNAWLNKRLRLNSFFRDSGYNYLNISQKVFPIPYLDLSEPQGRELAMRINPEDAESPIRNYLTTISVARLLFEIYSNQSISAEYSELMKSHLHRNLARETWNHDPFNSIEGFLGESLPADMTFYSKAGWTSESRNDAAIIESSDGKIQYILVVFGDDISFAEDENIFPIISSQVYSLMMEEYKPAL